MGRRRMRATLGELRSVRGVAIAIGRPYRSTHRLLRTLHARDVERGRGAWLVQRTPKGAILVNLPMLRAEHRELFAPRETPAHELPDLFDRLRALELGIAEERKRSRALAARVRDLESALRVATPNDTAAE